MSLHNMKGEYVVNPNGNLIKMRLKMDMSMTMDGETMTMSMDGDVGIADPGQPVDVPVPNVAEYTGYNGSSQPVHRPVIKRVKVMPATTQTRNLVYNAVVGIFGGVPKRLKVWLNTSRSVALARGFKSLLRLKTPGAGMGIHSC